MVVLDLTFVISHVRRRCAQSIGKGLFTATGEAWLASPRPSFWPARHERRQHPENHGNTLIRKRFCS